MNGFEARLDSRVQSMVTLLKKLDAVASWKGKL